MMSKSFAKLEEMLCDALDEIVMEGKLSSAILDNIDHITHSLKALKTIEAMEGDRREASR